MVERSIDAELGETDMGVFGSINPAERIVGVPADLGIFDWMRLMILLILEVFDAALAVVSI